MGDVKPPVSHGMVLVDVDEQLSQGRAAATFDLVSGGGDRWCMQEGYRVRRKTSTYLTVLTVPMLRICTILHILMWAKDSCVDPALASRARGELVSGHDTPHTGFPSL